MGSKGGGGSSANIPNPPSVKDSYKQGANIYLRYLPQFLGAEANSRTNTDPTRIAEQQSLQRRFGPEQYREQLSAMQMLDPAFMSVRGQVAHRVSDDLSQGMALTPSQMNQTQQNVRMSQAARGNVYGDSAGQAEAYALGDRGMQMYQQRLQNAAGFLQQPTMASQIQQVAPVSPDRSFSYVDPSAGFQGINAANARYQGLVGAAAANSGGGGGSNIWGSVIGAVGGIAGALI